MNFVLGKNALRIQKHFVHLDTEGVLGIVGDLLLIDC